MGPGGPFFSIALAGVHARSRRNQRALVFTCRIAITHLIGPTAEKRWKEAAYEGFENGKTCRDDGDVDFESAGGEVGSG